MRIPIRSLCTLAVAVGVSGAGLSQAATIRIIQDPLPPVVTLTPMHGSKSVLAGSMQDPPRQGSLCACISRDTLAPADSACVSAPVGAGSLAGSAESRATIALAAALLDVPHRPALQSMVKSGSGGLASLLTQGRSPLVPGDVADTPVALSDPINTGTGLGGGGGGFHITITADPLPTPPETPVPTPTEGQTATATIPVIPLPATGLLLIGALATTLSLRRRSGSS